MVVPYSPQARARRSRASCQAGCGLWIRCSAAAAAEKVRVKMKSVAVNPSTSRIRNLPRHPGTLVPGWRGKFLILLVLGFTATDFIFTRTFSAAAAAEHLIHNPQPAWQDALDRLARACGEYGTTIDHPFADWLRHHADKQLAVTVVLLLLSSLLTVVFFRGFSRGLLRLAVVVVAAYLLLNAVVLGSGVAYLTR